MTDGNDGAATVSEFGAAAQTSRQAAEQPERSSESETFTALGGETRLAILDMLAEHDSPQTFSTLFDASEEETSAGFAYHLRQLAGQFVHKRPDERYELTDAGRRIVQARRAGAYTASVDRDSTSLAESCPHCEQTELVVTVADNLARVSCEDCGQTVLALPFPPSGYESRDALPAAFDTYHRNRISSFSTGVCPDCGGQVISHIQLSPVETAETHSHGSTSEATETHSHASTSEATETHSHASTSEATETQSEEITDAGSDSLTGQTPSVQAVFECGSCGVSLQCPLSLTVLDHPAVVSFYHSHGTDIRDTPVWTASGDWHEQVLSCDPLRVRLSTALDGEELALSVGPAGTVVDHRQYPDPDDETNAASPITPEQGDDAADDRSDVKQLTADDRGTQESSNDGTATGGASA